MDADDEGSGDCLLGRPGRPIRSAEDTNPCVSKIGGYPVWHDTATAPSLPEHVLCRSCQSADDVLLVMQIFAPTDRPRSIYVFCCNKRACSLAKDSSGWIIVRNQAVEPYHTESSTEYADSTTGGTSRSQSSLSGESGGSSSNRNSSSSSSKTNSDDSTSKAGVCTSSESEAKVSEWLDICSWGSGSGDDMDDLAAMLEKRDLRLKSEGAVREQSTSDRAKSSVNAKQSNSMGPTIKASTTQTDADSVFFVAQSPAADVLPLSAKPDDESTEPQGRREEDEGSKSVQAASPLVCKKRWNAFRIIDEYDPVSDDNSDKGALGGIAVGIAVLDEQDGDDVDDEDEDEEEEEDDDERFYQSAASEQHVRELLARYQQSISEEQEQGPGRSSGIQGEVHHDRKLQSDVEAPVIPSGGSGKDKTLARAGKGWRDGDSHLERKLQRRGDGHRFELAFQRVVSRLPSQVLRYCYGGEPLWPSVPPMLSSRAAMCKPFAHKGTSGKGKHVAGRSSDSADVRCSCGRERVFEFQLMPALLALGLSAIESSVAEQPRPSPSAVSTSTSLSIAPSHPGAEAEAEDGATEGVTRPTSSQVEALLKSLDTGVDFGTVAVFSCPASCSSSHRELAIVYPPSDIPAITFNGRKERN